MVAPPHKKAVESRGGPTDGGGWALEGLHIEEEMEDGDVRVGWHHTRQAAEGDAVSAVPARWAIGVEMWSWVSLGWWVDQVKSSQVTYSSAARCDAAPQPAWTVTESNVTAAKVRQGAAGGEVS